MPRAVSAMMTTTNGTPALYDPAVYYGHREIDLAMTELFGGFPSRFYEAYNANFPLEPDYKNRRLLYQLYPLMVHMNLFGGGYAAQVLKGLERICRAEQSLLELALRCSVTCHRLTSSLP